MNLWSKILLVIRWVVFIAIAPIVAVVMALIFLMPYNLDFWFSENRRTDAANVWRKLWKWTWTGSAKLESASPAP